MKLVLTAPGRLETQAADQPAAQDGMTPLTVEYCGICRTDAKMWRAGHRDLVLPRVPGHEVVTRDHNGRLFTVWPGQACGRCRHCLSDRENLCDGIRIMGFHFDGGFSHHLLAPIASLIPVPIDIPSHLACFAEPVGCALNALEKVGLGAGERLAIYGGGTLGLVAALAARTVGAQPLVIDNNPEKIAKSEVFRQMVQVTARSAAAQDDEFDAVLNACPDPEAFVQGLARLARGGRCAFFSGLTGGGQLPADGINLIHYKEAAVFGAYGLTRRHMMAALALIGRYPGAFELLVEAIVPPHDVERRFCDLLEGRSFKTILDFRWAGDYG